MLNKKVTRKEFLLGAMSLGAIFIASKVPSVLKKEKSIKEGNHYGNYSYGGIRKNNA